MTRCDVTLSLLELRRGDHYKQGFNWHSSLRNMRGHVAVMQYCHTHIKRELRNSRLLLLLHLLPQQ